MHAQKFVGVRVYHDPDESRRLPGRVGPTDRTHRLLAYFDAVTASLSLLYREADARLARQRQHLARHLVAY